MTQEEIDLHIEEARELMEHAIEHLKHELATLRAGKASARMLDGIMVEYYGVPTPLQQVSNVTAPDGKTITIQPWEKHMLAVIEKAIFEANLGLTPVNNGEMIIINVPPLTEERRRELVKKAKAHGEETRIAIRNARHKAMDFIKKAVKDGYPEDMGKRMEEQVQELTNQYVKKVDELLKAKEADIMTI